MRMLLIMLGFLGASGCATVDDPFSDAFRNKSQSSRLERLNNQGQPEPQAQTEMAAFYDELRSCRIEMPEAPGPHHTWPIPLLLACVQARANAVLPPSLPIRILAVLPNYPVREETFTEVVKQTDVPEIPGLDTDMSVYGMVHLYTDLFGLQIEFAPKSRTIILYAKCQP